MIGPYALLSVDPTCAGLPSSRQTCPAQWPGLAEFAQVFEGV
jgi:hypothetical protein